MFGALNDQIEFDIHYLAAKWHL